MKENDSPGQNTKGIKLKTPVRSVVLQPSMVLVVGSTINLPTVPVTKFHRQNKNKNKGHRTQKSRKKTIKKISS